MQHTLSTRLISDDAKLNFANVDCVAVHTSAARKTDVERQFLQMSGDGFFVDMQLENWVFYKLRMGQHWLTARPLRKKGKRFKLKTRRKRERITKQQN